jgi:hypothetical protein
MKTLITVTIPEIDAGQYFMTARVGFAGQAGATASCSADGGFEDAIASAYGDRQSLVLGANSQRSLKLDSVLIMRDDWTPIVFQCQASGLQDDQSVEIMSYHFALVRIG